MNKYINSTYIDKKLLRRIYIYFIFSIIMFIVSLYELYATNYKLIYAIIIELIWIWIWLLITRMFHISWNKEQKQVISKIDVLWWIDGYWECKYNGKLDQNESRRKWIWSGWLGT